MSVLLPWLFVALAVMAAVLASYFLYASVRSSFDSAAVEVGQLAWPERDALLSRKDGLLRAIKDLEFDHEAGKLNADQFKQDKRTLAGELRGCLDALEAQLQPFRKRLDEALATNANSDAPGAKTHEDNASAESTATPSEAAPSACGACGLVNDDDATFCKSCGEKLVSDA